MSDQRTTPITAPTSTRPATRRRSTWAIGATLASAILLGACGSSVDDDATTDRHTERTSTTVGDRMTPDADHAVDRPEQRSAEGAGAPGEVPEAPTERVDDRRSSAATAWSANAGRSYFLVFDIDSEGLSGTYCVGGIAGDPAHADDLGGLGAAGPICSSEGVRFTGPPAAVEQLLVWADDAVADGGTVEFDSAGVPTLIDRGPGGDFHLEVVEFAWNDDDPGSAGSGVGGGGSSSQQDALDAARARWSAGSPPEYVWVTTFSSEGLTELRCIDHTPASGTVSVVDDPGCVAGPTVPEVFDDIQDAIDEGATVTVAYDSLDGHPVSVTAPYPTGDGWSLTQSSYDVPE